MSKLTRVYYSRKGYWKWLTVIKSLSAAGSLQRGGLVMAQKAGYMADLPASTKTHSMT